MAATGYTPISLYYSTTAAAVPTSGNLVSGELAINITDGKLYYKNNSGTVTLLATAGSTSSQWTTTGSDIYYNTGNVLVGATASNGYKFEATATTDVAQFIATDAGASGAQIQLFHDSASPAVDDVTSLINFAGRDSAAQSTIYSRISGISTNVTNGSESGAIAFSTRNTGTFAERMRLDSAGNLLVGSTVKQVGSVPSIWANSATAANGGIGFVPDYEGAGEHSVVSYSASSSTFKGLNFDGTTIKFWTGPSGVSSERARFDSSGNFGLGTASPVAKLDLAGDYKEGVVTANTSTAYTISLAAGTVQILTLTGNCTYTFPTPVAGKSFTLVQAQDATGSRTVTWPASVDWPSATAPTLTATALKVDKFVFTAISGTSWLGSVAGQNYTV